MTEPAQTKTKSSGCVWWPGLLIWLGVASAGSLLGWSAKTRVLVLVPLLLAALVVAVARQQARDRSGGPQVPPGRPAPLSIGGEPEEERRKVLGRLRADLGALLAARQEAPQVPPGQLAPLSMGAGVGPSDSTPQPEPTRSEAESAPEPTKAPEPEPMKPPQPEPQARGDLEERGRMRWLSDPGDRTGADRVVYRIGSWIGIVLMVAAVAAAVAVVWWLIARS
jgi:hypothetical protein